NIKQEEFANFLNISQSNFSKIENGKTFVTFEQVINIANHYKISLFEFLPDDFVEIQQLDFRIQLEELYSELKMHKETNMQLIKLIKNLEAQLKNKGKDLENRTLKKISSK
ncbi:MAG: helix-turn-helix transcriptional regulator, partial [Bacteroidetes bacterium]|nr:helix-turn-helix transcriptional regulator [Bacteroidota bacterium]